MFGISDQSLFKPRALPGQLNQMAQPSMPSPIAGAVGIGDPTALQPQASNTAPPPALTMPLPTPASMPAPNPMKRGGPQFVGGVQGLL